MNAARLHALVLVTLLFSFGAVPTPGGLTAPGSARAADTALVAPTVILAGTDRIATALTVTASTVKPEFPRQIAFTLTAESSAAEISEVKLFYRPVAASVTQLATPKFTRGRRVELTHTVDMVKNYLPPGIDLQYWWSLTDAAGNKLDTAPSVFRYQDERFAWRTRQGGQVTVLFYAGNDSFGQELLDTALRTIDRLGRSFGVTGNQPIHIVVYGSNRDFTTSLPPNSAEWIGGQAHPDLGLIVTGIQPGNSASAEMRRIIPHEISHQLLYQATENPYGGPAHWLDEGLAVYNQETPDTSFGPLLSRAVQGGTLIPVRALNANFPLDPNEARLSYAESLSLIEYIIKTYGEVKLGALLTSFRAELSTDEALQAALGIDSDTLDRDWKASLGYTGDKPGAAVPVADNPLSASSQPFSTGPLALALRWVLPLGGLSIIVVSGYFLRWRRSGP